MAQWRDTRNGYGWASIILHWLGAAAIFALWFVGDSIGADGGVSSGMLRLHISLALSFYALLAARIYWRARYRHPVRLPSQARVPFALGTVVHYAILACIAVMLLTGPVVAWSGDVPLSLFGLVLPSPLARDPALFETLHAIHAWTAAALMILALLHIGGGLVHMTIPKDRTFDRMMIPERRDRS